jgi:hypothetical protein
MCRLAPLPRRTPKVLPYCGEYCTKELQNAKEPIPVESIERFVQMGMGVAIVPSMCVQSMGAAVDPRARME